jgi:hypothetical protein
MLTSIALHISERSQLRFGRRQNCSNRDFCANQSDSMPFDSAPPLPCKFNRC